MEVTNLDDDPQLLQVIGFEPTSSGFVAMLSQPLDTSVLNVADDVQVVGSVVGPVRGSIVLAPNRQQVTFIRTGGILEPDTYTVTLRSGVTAFVRHDRPGAGRERGWYGHRRR